MEQHPSAWSIPLLHPPVVFSTRPGGRTRSLPILGAVTHTWGQLGCVGCTKGDREGEEGCKGPPGPWHHKATLVCSGFAPKDNAGVLLVCMAGFPAPCIP